MNRGSNVLGDEGSSRGGERVLTPHLGAFQHCQLRRELNVLQLLLRSDSCPPRDIN